MAEQRADHDGTTAQSLCKQRHKLVAGQLVFVDHGKVHDACRNLVLAHEIHRELRLERPKRRPITGGSSNQRLLHGEKKLNVRVVRSETAHKNLKVAVRIARRAARLDGWW